MIKLNQGDTSDIIVLEDESGSIISDVNWTAELVIVSSENNTRPLIKKIFAKDLEANVFYTVLYPKETIKLNPGRYVISYQITNKKLGYRKEIKDKLRINKQIVWNNNEDEFGFTIPGYCIYTDNGSFPKEDCFLLN